ncbi:MAG: response regulator [Candidatus Dormibacteria bacterium]
MMVADRQRIVLCVDDEEAYHRLVARALRSRPDIRVVPATLGALALELCSSDPPDLVLLDMELPDMPGMTLLSALRATAATAAIPVIVLSGGPDAGVQAQLAFHGASILARPFTAAALMGAVLAAVGAA